MAQVKLQTKLAHRKLTTVVVNGTKYDIDKDCCILVDNENDEKRLLALGDEWTKSISLAARLGPSRTPAAGAPMRSAAEFIALCDSDVAVADKVNTLRSFVTLASFAAGLGFRFTEAEFRAAGEAFEASRTRSKTIDVKNEEKTAASKEPKGKGKKGKEKAADEGATPTADEALPEVLPEETSGEWPDPKETHSLAYLRRMADAYGVKYAADSDKPTLIEAIRPAMYDEDETE